MRRFRAAMQDEAGDSMVEFALVLPLLLLVLLAVVQFALVHHAQDVATVAGQEGARLAANEDGGPAEGDARAQEVLHSGLGRSADGFDVTASQDDDVVTVATQGSYPLILPWFGSPDIPVGATATMRKEGFRDGP